MHEQEHFLLRTPKPWLGTSLVVLVLVLSRPWTGESHVGPMKKTVPGTGGAEALRS